MPVWQVRWPWLNCHLEANLLLRGLFSSEPSGNTKEPALSTKGWYGAGFYFDCIEVWVVLIGRRETSRFVYALGKGDKVRGNRKKTMI